MDPEVLDAKITGPGVRSPGFHSGHVAAGRPLAPSEPSRRAELDPLQFHAVPALNRTPLSLPCSLSVMFYFHR